MCVFLHELGFLMSKQVEPQALEPEDQEHDEPKAPEKGQQQDREQLKDVEMMDADADAWDAGIPDADDQAEIVVDDVEDARRRHGRGVPARRRGVPARRGVERFSTG